jgi:hypothetical protein
LDGLVAEKTLRGTLKIGKIIIKKNQEFAPGDYVSIKNEVFKTAFIPVCDMTKYNRFALTQPKKDFVVTYYFFL